MQQVAPSRRTQNVAKWDKSTVLSRNAILSRVSNNRSLTNVIADSIMRTERTIIALISIPKAMVSKVAAEEIMKTDGAMENVAEALAENVETSVRKVITALHAKKPAAASLEEVMTMMIESTTLFNA